MKPLPISLRWVLVVALGTLGCASTPRVRRDEPASVSSRRSTPSSRSRPSSTSAQARERASVEADSHSPQEDLRRMYANRTVLRTLMGAASYYSDALSGRPTASGEPYDPRGFTAANRDFAFGTMLRVVRVDTGASVIVRVNDRGPFGRRRRIVDLSRAAAEHLDMIRRGVVNVRVEVLEEGAGRRGRVSTAPVFHELTQRRSGGLARWTRSHEAPRRACTGHCRSGGAWAFNDGQ